jgi:hypothetical protein
MAFVVVTGMVVVVVVGVRLSHQDNKGTENKLALPKVRPADVRRMNAFERPRQRPEIKGLAGLVESPFGRPASPL